MINGKKIITNAELSSFLGTYLLQNNLESIAIMCEIDENNYLDIHIIGGKK